MVNHGNIKIFAGRAGVSLAMEVCKFLSIDLGKAIVGSFKDGEVRVELHESVSDCDVFIINPTCPPAENFMDMCLLADASRNSSASRVTLVPSYLGYNRQDKKDRSRVPYSGTFVMDILKATLANRVLLFDIHSEATAGYFKPLIVDHLYGSQILRDYLKKILGKNFVVASPDKGGVQRASAYAKRLGKSESDYIIFNKDRIKPNEVESDRVKIGGSVRGKNVLLVDDMIDTGGTMIADAKAAKRAGAKKIFACATHGLFSADAIKKLSESPIDEVIITNTIPQKQLQTSKKSNITVISIAPLIAKAIQHRNSGQSLSSLID